MSTILIIGATRGLGLSLANAYASNSSNTVYGTTRSSSPPSSSPSSNNPAPNHSIHWVPNIDLLNPEVGNILVNQLGQLGVRGKGNEEPGNESKGAVKGFDIVIVSAGYFATEEWGKKPGQEGGLSWEKEVRTYTTSSIAPPILIHTLHAASLLRQGSKILLLSSESGSITLRHPSEGGGNYAHHASKSALNMVGKLLSLDLADDDIVVSIVHPGFMRTEMTAGVGFDKFWDDGGAVSPDVAAASLVEWVGGLEKGRSGEYWAPRGWGDIGTAEAVLGAGVVKKDGGKGPVKLPW